MPSWILGAALVLGTNARATGRINSAQRIDNQERSGPPLRLVSPFGSSAKVAGHY